MDTQRGFALSELLIVVAIIAHLAALALPAYTDYLTRAEGFYLATIARAAVATRYAEHGVYPNGAAGPGVPLPSSTNSRYVRSVTIDANGTIAVVSGNTASLKVAGQTPQLALQNEGDSLHSDCSGLPPRYLPSACS